MQTVMEGTRETQDFKTEKINANAEATKVYPQLKAGDKHEYLSDLVTHAKTSRG